MTFLNNFYAFEGIDGCGKTVISQEVANYFLGDGYLVHWVSEPCTNAECKLMYSPEQFAQIKHDPHITSLFYAAWRAFHYSKCVLPNLDGRHELVITDRCFASSIAYQGYGQLSAEKKEVTKINAIKNLNDIATQNNFPKRVFYLAIEPEIAQDRMKFRGNMTQEERDLAFQERVAYGYEELYGFCTDWWTKLDATKPISDLVTIISNAIEYDLNQVD